MPLFDNSKLAAPAVKAACAIVENISPAGHGAQRTEDDMFPTVSLQSSIYIYLSLSLYIYIYIYVFWGSGGLEIAYGS